MSAALSLPRQSELHLQPTLTDVIEGLPRVAHVQVVEVFLHLSNLVRLDNDVRSLTLQIATVFTF